jgi:hypothetical protein
MKKLMLLNFALFGFLISNCQNDTSRIEQYCQLIATPRLLSNKVTIDIDFGEERTFWRDNRLKTYDGKLKKFNSVIDALNFMGKDGWQFVGAYPVHIGTEERFHFGFKKAFLKSEIQQ